MGSMHHSTLLPLGLAFESCRLCPLGRWGLLAALLPRAGGGDSPAPLPCPNAAGSHQRRRCSCSAQIELLFNVSRVGAPPLSVAPYRAAKLSEVGWGELPGEGCPHERPRASLHGHSLLSLPGMDPGAPAAPGRTYAKDQLFSGVLGCWMRSQRWEQDGSESLQCGCRSPCPCTAAGQGAVTWGDPGVPPRSGSQACVVG